MYKDILSPNSKTKLRFMFLKVLAFIARLGYSELKKGEKI